MAEKSEVYTGAGGRGVPPPMACKYGKISFSPWKWCTISWNDESGKIMMSGRQESSYAFSAGTKKWVYQCFLAAIAAGNIPFILLIDQSSQSSQKKRDLLIVSSRQPISAIRKSIAVAMGTSNCVPVFFTSEGARLRSIFLGGSSIPRLRNVERIRSFDSFTAASGSPMISIVGSALFISASIVTSYPLSQSVTNVFTNADIVFVFEVEGLSLRVLSHIHNRIIYFLLLFSKNDFRNKKRILKAGSTRRKKKGITPKTMSHSSFLFNNFMLRLTNPWCANLLKHSTAQVYRAEASNIKEVLTQLL